jgi:hypothetical protein
MTWIAPSAVRRTVPAVARLALFMARKKRALFYQENRMDKFEVKAQRLVALCMLGVLLFNYPILALFNVAATVFGIPVLYAYIFTAWSLLIVSMAYVVETKA